MIDRKSVIASPTEEEEEAVEKEEEEAYNGGSKRNANARAQLGHGMRALLLYLDGIDRTRRF